MKRYSITFRIETSEDWESVDVFESELKDIIQSTVAPTFNFKVIPLSFEVKRSRIR